MRRHTVCLLGLLLTASVLHPAAAAAAPLPMDITADLDGTPIPATEVGSYFCHDFAFPRLRCYSTGGALDAAVAAMGTAVEDELSLAAYGANDYVTIYSEASFGGSYAHLSQSYDGLWVIGWNDRISSYKARNSALGSFHVDWYAGGARLDFCCNQTTASLSSTFNDAISSVYRR